MKILEAQVQSESSRRFYKEDLEINQTITRRVEDPIDKTKQDGGSAIPPGVGIQDLLFPFDIVSLGFHQDKSGMTQESTASESNLTDTDEESISDPKLMMMKRMIEYLTGKKIDVTRISHQPQDQVDVIPENSSSTPDRSDDTENSVTDILHYESHYEHEKTQFQSSGTVMTEDGHTLNFHVSINMEREYFTEEAFYAENVQRSDPLVIRYQGNAVELSGQTFQFDLNSDGSSEEISYLKPGSGFLVFDKNNDEKVNNGSELFGALTGKGFGELANYDRDRNRWIDENDSIYNNLFLWKKDESGEDSLVSLKDAGIGAISLSHENTVFSIKDYQNNNMGFVKQTGVFLKDNGQSGIIQEIDFVI